MLVLRACKRSKSKLVGKSNLHALSLLAALLSMVQATQVPPARQCRALANISADRQQRYCNLLVSSPSRPNKSYIATGAGEEIVVQEQ